MRSKGFDGMVCSIAGALAAMGDRWGLLILRDLSHHLGFDGIHLLPER